MSEYVECETQILDQDALLAALEEMGYTVVEVGENLSLYGYQGDRRKETADVVIRRKYVGHASNDLGFKKQKDGSFKVIISKYDQGQKRNFVKDVTYLSGVHNAMKQAKKRGYKVRRTNNEHGEVVLNFKKY